MRWLPGIGMLAVVTGLLVGQATSIPAKKKTDLQGPSGRASADVHSEPRSREMFTACDGNSDDRLDLFEASEALEALGDPKDGKSFLRLDGDRDGFLAWPEFDLHFRSVVRRGSTFRVQTCRRLVQQAPEQQQPRAATPLQKFLKLYDGNANGGLDPDEIDKMVQALQLAPAIGSQLKALDLDNSGRIEETELAAKFEEFAPRLELLRSVLPFPLFGAPKAAVPMAAPWGSLDEDGDGAIGLDELTGALRRLDSGLERWAKHLLQRLDADKNGKLTPEELPGATTAGPGAKTAVAAVRPLPDPLAAETAPPAARSR